MQRRIVVLPQPLGPEQRQRVPLADRERHVVDGDEIAEPLGQVADGDEGFGPGAVGAHE